MHYINKIIFLLTFIAPKVLGADVWSVKCNKMNLDFAFGSIIIERSPSDALSTIKILDKEGKSISLPKEEIEDIHAPDIQSVRVISNQSKQIKSLESMGDQDCLIIVLEYGKTIDVAVDGVDANGFKNSIQVTSQVFFTFTKFGYAQRERRVCRSHSSEWLLYYKTVGSKELENGTEKIEDHDKSLLSPPSLPIRN